MSEMESPLRKGLRVASRADPKVSVVFPFFFSLPFPSLFPFYFPFPFIYKYTYLLLTFPFPFTYKYIYLSTGKSVSIYFVLTVFSAVSPPKNPAANKNASRRFHFKNRIGFYPIPKSFFPLHISILIYILILILISIYISLLTFKM